MIKVASACPSRRRPIWSNVPVPSTSGRLTQRQTRSRETITVASASGMCLRKTNRQDRDPKGRLLAPLATSNRSQSLMGEPRRAMDHYTKVRSFISNPNHGARATITKPLAAWRHDANARHGEHHPSDTYPQVSRRQLRVGRGFAQCSSLCNSEFT